MKRIQNCTPHTINLHLDNGHNFALEPSGVVPRVEFKKEPCKSPETEYGNVPVSIIYPGVVSGLPDKEPDTLLVVSQVVANAAPERRDLIFPLDLIRDDKGRIIGCKGFGKVSVVRCSKCEDTGMFEVGDFGGSLAKCHCRAGDRYEAEIQKGYKLRYEDSVP